MYKIHLFLDLCQMALINVNDNETDFRFIVEVLSITFGKN